MSYISKDDIVKHVNIIDIAGDNMVNVESVSSGSFDYKCTCPCKSHKGGTERTKSCYINSIDNNFYCFGCNAGHNVIDFYILCTDCSFSDAMFYLRGKIDPELITGDKKYVSKRSNMPILIDVYSLFRKYSEFNDSDSEWITSFMKKVDFFVGNIGRYDIKKTRSLYNSVKKRLINRYGDA